MHHYNQPLGCTLTSILELEVPLDDWSLETRDVVQNVLWLSFCKRPDPSHEHRVTLHVYNVELLSARYTIQWRSRFTIKGCAMLRDSYIEAWPTWP